MSHTSNLAAVVKKKVSKKKNSLLKCLVLVPLASSLVEMI